MSTNCSRERAKMLVEEITFFRDVCGFNDRDIAHRLNMQWATYLVFRRRHPELGPLNDPVQKDRDEQIRLNRVFGLPLRSK